MSEILGIKLADQHYWVDKYLNGQPVGICIFHGYEELVDGMNELIEEAGKEIRVPVAEKMYSQQATVTITNNKYGNEIKLEITPCYTEEECIAAGIFDAPGAVVLDKSVWSSVFFDL